MTNIVYFSCSIANGGDGAVALVERLKGEYGINMGCK